MINVVNRTVFEKNYISGSRFALMEIKLIAFHLLSKFDIVPSEKTQIPIKLEKNSFFLKPEKGVFVGLKPRKI